MKQVLFHEQALIHKVEQDVVRRSFATYDDLRTAVYSSLVRYLEQKEIIRRLPFDATAHPTATWEAIDAEMHRVEPETNRVDAKTNRVSAKTNRVKLSKKQLKVIAYCSEPRTAREIIETCLELSYQTRTVKKYVTDLVNLDLLRPLFPESLHAPVQKYIAVQKD